MHKPGLLHQYTEVVQAWALLSVKCMDSEVCTDKFCTESESDKGVSLTVLYR